LIIEEYSRKHSVYVNIHNPMYSNVVEICSVNYKNN